MHINNAHIIIVVYHIMHHSGEVLYQQLSIIYLRVCTSGRDVSGLVIYIYNILLQICVCTYILHTSKIIRAFPFSIQFLFYSRPTPLDFLFIAGINERHHYGPRCSKLSSTMQLLLAAAERNAHYLFTLFIFVKSVYSGTKITH